MTAAVELTGKVAVVTGAGSGIGEACAGLMAARGAKVLVADIDAGQAEGVAKAITADGGEALAFSVDVTDPAAVEGMVATAVGELGGLDIGVNNAGIGGASSATGDYPVDGWRTVMSVNLDGVFYCAREEIRAMRERGGGSIVNMASILGAVGFANSVAYVSAKHGVVGLTKNAALEHAADGIRVNAVGPGFIRTPLVESSMDAEALAFLEGLHALGRLGTSEEVAELVAWLASDAASFVTGSYYPVDGGYLAR
ncbi:MAG TPA: SDR family NAD(P)-dependent oxidoreductase [Actinomycetota bacterium]|nr:SDR family NAD(P)-dependent oxidoreductase [Actinomycetota bacterium]